MNHELRIIRSIIHTIMILEQYKAMKEAKK